MRTKSLVMIICLGVVTTALGSPALPKDVQTFINNAERCDHAAGEFDGALSKARQREIERAVVKYCGAAQRQLKQLRTKYRSDARMRELLQQHANDSVTSFR